MGGPRISGIAVHWCHQEMSPECRRGHVQAGDIGLGQLCGVVCSLRGRKSPAAPRPAIPAWMPTGSCVGGCGTSPSRPASKLSLIVLECGLHRQVVCPAAFDSHSPNAALARHWCTCWATSSAWAVSNDDPLNVQRSTGWRGLRTGVIMRQKTIPALQECVL